MSILVYNHNHDCNLRHYGPLQRMAVAAGLQMHSKSNDNNPVINDLVGANTSVLFVHINPDEWKTLCDALPENRYAMRFSTGELPFTPKHYLERGFLNCAKKIGGDELSESDFKELIALFSDETKLTAVRDGEITQALRGLIRYKEPHKLRALSILIQGLFAMWAGDGSNPSRALRSCQALGLAAPPPALGYYQFDDTAIFKQCLGFQATGTEALIRDELAKEFGASDWAAWKVKPSQNDIDESACKSFIELLASNKNNPISEDDCFGAFRWIQKELGEQ